MNELALFAGAGGGVLGGHLLGWRTVCAVEVEPYPASVLAARQNDGVFPPFPIWDDIRTFQGEPWRGVVDVVSGGFPCQDISAAGKGAGIGGERSGLWREMFRVVCEVRPRFVFVENSPMLASRGLGRVLGDLASVGYDAAWDVFGADDVGAPHIRKRMWILAYANCAWEQQSSGALPESRGWAGNGCSQADVAEPQSERCDRRRLLCRDAEAFSEPSRYGEDVPHAHLPGREEQRGEESAREEHAAAQCGGWWGSEPAVGRMADGVAARVDRIKALGNGQVPMVAAMAFSVLYNRYINN